MPKTLMNSYLYTKYPEYGKKMLDFVMKAQQIEKNDESFEDIKYEIKRRQISNSLIKVLESKNVILLTSGETLPKSLKVFVVKDIKSDNKPKVFIDTNAVLYKSNGVWKCNNIDILVAYLVAAMNSWIYQIDERKIILNNSVAADGARCFSSLFTHIVDYVCKISVSSSTKAKCKYLTSMYYLCNILQKDEDNEGVRSIARKISGISEREEDIINIQIDKDAYLNIKFFVDTLRDSLKTPNLTLDIIVDKWMFMFGPSTVFGLEYYPAFAQMITDAYVNCYINNQKTIEKITGQSMVDFSKTILSIGEGAVG